jgi:hypothetical protein
VTVGDPLTFDDVELDESSALVRAWHLQRHLDRLDGYGELAG